MLLSDEEQKGFFDQVLAGAHAAEQAMGSLAEDIEVGGTVVRLLFAGAALRDILLPAIAHLRVEPGRNPDLIVHVWESEASGIALPPAPCQTSLFSDRGELWTMRSSVVRSAYNWMECSLSLLDLERGEGIYWVRAIDRIPYWVEAAPFRALLNWWMEANDGQLLHAAAIGIGDDALLITGKGGSGKSSTALACLQAGMSYLGDDYVVVRGGEEPRVWSLYRTAKVDEATMERFAGMGPRLRRHGDDSKAVITLGADLSHGLARSMRIRAVLTPEFSGRPETRLMPIKRQRIRDAALFTTLCQLPHVGQRALSFIDRLLDRAPAFLLSLGSDRDAVPAALSALLGADSELERPEEGRETPADLPLVSVVIPVHNGARFLADAVGSVLAQNYPALDIIVVDDGSLDDLAAAVAELPVDVRLLKQLNAGPAAARNRGLVNAAGDYLAFLDVDDLWTPGFLEEGMRCLLADEGMDVVMGRSRVIVQDPYDGEWRDQAAAESFPYTIGLGIYRRRAFRAIGLFDEKLRFGEDSDWFLRARDRGATIDWTDRTTMIVRRHDSNMTRGKSGTELVPLRLFKNVLERRRAKESG